MLEQVFAKLLLERFSIWHNIYIYNIYIYNIYIIYIYRYTYYTPTSFSQAIHSFLLLMIQEFNKLPGLVIFELFFLGMYNTHWWVVLFAACHEHGLSGNIPESQVPVPLSEERCEDLRWLGCYWLKRLSFLKNDKCNWNWCLISYTTHWVFQISLFAFIVIRVLVRSAETNIVVKIDWDRPPKLLG